MEGFGGRHPADDVLPRWSPHGPWSPVSDEMIFISDRDHRHEIFVMQCDALDHLRPRRSLSIFEVEGIPGFLCVENTYLARPVGHGRTTDLPALWGDNEALNASGMRPRQGRGPVGARQPVLGPLEEFLLEFGRRPGVEIAGAVRAASCWEGHRSRR